MPGRVPAPAGAVRQEDHLGLEAVSLQRQREHRGRIPEVEQGPGRPEEQQQVDEQPVAEVHASLVGRIVAGRSIGVEVPPHPLGVTIEVARVKENSDLLYPATISNHPADSRDRGDQMDSSAKGRPGVQGTLRGRLEGKPGVKGNGVEIEAGGADHVRNTFGIWSWTRFAGASSPRSRRSRGAILWVRRRAFVWRRGFAGAGLASRLGAF